MTDKTISHYKILEKPGDGGMGIVYKAEDTKLKRTVALKFLPLELSRDEDAKGRFTQEAEAASALDHNNICTIHEINETDDGQMFIAMACYDGETLKKKIERGPLKIEEAIDNAVQISEGLSKAHEKEIVHRDLKPANVMITKDGVIKIVDFGLAKLSGRTQLTKEGVSMGTVAYMSPEQAQGLAVDHRTDIWALGVVLYETITGQQPFAGDYEQAVIYSIMNEEPEPITGLRSGLPLELERIINKCLAKEPAERYGHTDELLSDLRKLRKELQNGSPSTGRTSRHQGKTIWLRPAPFSILALLLLVSIFVLPKLQRKTELSGIESEENSLAVLYFENLKDPEDSERYGQILQELIITDLSDVTALRVYSSQRLYDIQKQLGVKDRKTIDRDRATEIARKAGARTMLTGNLMQLGDRLIITSQLIDVNKGTVLKSQRTDGEDLYGMVDDLTSQVHNDLDFMVTEEEQLGLPISTKTTTSIQAYKHYLAGVDYLNDVKYDKAILELQAAVSIDSSFGQAYYKLAIAQEWSTHVTNNMAQESLSYLLTKKLYTSNKEKLIAQAKLAYVAGRYDESQSIFEQVVKDYPDEKEAWYGLGETYFHSTIAGMDNKALAAFDRAIALDPTFTLAYIHILDHYRNLRKYKKIVEYAKQLIELESGKAYGYMDLLNALIMQGDTLEVQKVQEAALNLVLTKEDQIELFESTGRAYDSRGDYKNWEALMRAAIKRQPQNPLAHRYLLKALIHKRDSLTLRTALPEALEYHSTREKKKELFYIMGLAYRYIRDYKNAETYLLKAIAIKKDSSNSDILFVLAPCLALQKKFNMAKKSLLEALSIKPNGWKHYELCLVALEQKEYEEAIDYAKKGLELFPKHVFYHSLLLRAFLEGSRFAQADSVLEKGLSMFSSTNNDLHYLLVESTRVYARQHKNDKALQLLKRVEILELENPLEWTFPEFISLNIELKNYPAAEWHIQKALAIDSTNASALELLGYVLTEQKRFSEAVKTAQKFFSMEPSFYGYSLLSWALVTGDLDVERGIVFAQKALNLSRFFHERRLGQDKWFAWPEHTLGRAYLKIEDYQKAVWYLERAAQVLPYRQDIQEDLQMAKQKLNKTAL